MRIVVSDDPAADAAAAILRWLRGAVRHRGGASLAVSGGSTAPPMIAVIASALREQPDLAAALTVWQVDERVAPDGDAARNAGQLGDLPCAVRLMPVTSVDLRAAARRYASSMPERFDVVHLGIGDDGHTASWPPGEPGIALSNRLVEVTGTFNGWRRMTLTPHPVNTARARLVLAGGASKRPVVERWLRGDPVLPISHVRRVGTTVMLDELAAPGASLR
jgi:6-phosphogluconolactonase/glucosamine-6-phosphate isomerase/deaminase